MQRYIGWFLLSAGLIAGAVILAEAFRNRQRVRNERGNAFVIAILEVLVYIAATLGISDYLLNTLIARKLDSTEDQNLPGTLIACGYTPGAVIAFSLLRVDNPVETRTLIVCALSIVAGCLIGVRLVGGIDPKKIRRVMGIALIGSLIALIAKIIVSAGATGQAQGMSAMQLVIAVPFGIFWGAVNMIGVPMKPAGTAVFLLMGLSPLVTLSLVLVMGCVGPLSSAPSVLKRGAYHRKTVCAAVVFGTAGALIGTAFAISVNALVLNILLLVVMVIAIVSMLKGTKGDA